MAQPIQRYFVCFQTWINISKHSINLGCNIVYELWTILIFISQIKQKIRHHPDQILLEVFYKQKSKNSILLEEKTIN